MRHAMYGFAGGAALAAAAAWLLFAARTPPQPVAQPRMAVSAPVAAQQPQEEAAQLQSRARQAEPRTSAAVFEARFNASRDAPPPAPDPAILQARSFPEAFRALKRAEGQLPVEAAGANPFGGSR